MRLRGSKPLLAILGVALLVRIAVMVATPDFVPIFDAGDFHRHAASIADGHGYPRPQLGTEGPTAFRPPGYPVALAVVQTLGGGLTAERVLGALLGVVTVLLVYLIAARVWGPRVATVAGWIAAVFPPLAFLSASLLSELLFLPLALAAVLAVLRYRDDARLRWAAAAGVLCGLAVLTRTNGLLLVAALAVGVWTGRPLLARASLRPPVVLALAAALTLAPWVVRNTIVFDRFVGLGTGAGYALSGTYSPESRARAQHPGQPFAPNELRSYRRALARRDLDEAELVGLLSDRATRYIRDHPGYVVETAAWNLLRVFDFERAGPFGTDLQALELEALGVGRLDSKVVWLGSLYLVLALALLGAVAEARGARRAPVFVWLAPLLLLLPALAIYGLPRYRAPIDPFLVMLAAVGCVAAWTRLRPS
ncbi:MAG TPA: glycosyltransferase family 39 protein [Thermoleophilaceae bacterium]|nr:glycosyltransferase family 39 protein [Thermoleophilaceae bacterium]